MSNRPREITKVGLSVLCEIPDIPFIILLKTIPSQIPLLVPHDLTPCGAGTAASPCPAASSSHPSPPSLFFELKTVGEASLVKFYLKR
jgi:hypothetical protein